MTDTAVAPRPTIDVDKVKLAELSDVIVDLGKGLVEAKDEDGRKAALDLIANAAGRYMASGRHDDSDLVVHEEVQMKNYSTGEGGKGQEMRYAAERAALLALVAATQGVAAEFRTRKYRYSGGRREKHVHLFGYRSDVQRTLRIWEPLNDLLTIVAFSMKMDTGLTPQAQTRLRREFVTAWVKNIAEQIEAVVHARIESRNGAPARVSDRHTAAITALNEWAKEEAAEASETVED